MSGLDDAQGTALVAFTGKTELRRLRWLKPGYRHCLVATKKHAYWVFCDSLAHQLHFDVVADLDSVDLEFWLRRCGYRVVRTEIAAAPLEARFLRPFTCVEATKRVLGIEAGWVLTPWQLFRYLSRKSKKSRNKLIKKEKSLDIMN